MRRSISPRLAVGLGGVLALPGLLFASAQILKYYLNAPLLYNVLGPFASPGEVPIYGSLSPFLFLGGTFAAVVLNLLAVATFDSGKEPDGTWRLSIRMKPTAANVTVLLVAGGVLAVFLLYGLVENVGH